jgi:lon-related putative ATP-dependent protease
VAQRKNNLVEVAPEELRERLDPAQFDFETTRELCDMGVGVVAQERATEALKLGLGIRHPDYNIYVAGVARTGISYITENFVREQAKKQPTPPEWCYVYNFKEPDKPRTLKMPVGMGHELRRDMEELVKSLQRRIPEIFESEDYRAREAAVHAEFENGRRTIIDELSGKAAAEGFLLQFSQVGMMILPAKEGQPMSQEEIGQLPQEEKENLRRKSDKLQDGMTAAMKAMRDLERDFKEKHQSLDNEVVLYLVGHYLDDYREKYKDVPDILGYFQDVQEDILKSIEDFKKKEEPGPQLPFMGGQQEPSFKRYEVNVLTDNTGLEGAPVVIEANPNYPNLFGSIEREARFGTLFTDFTMIKAGSLHRANGGYLVIKALDLLKWPFSYEALKRSIQNREAKIEDIGELYGLITTRTLKPQPIPLNVRVVLMGDPWIYEILYAYDEQFPRMFKVKAHLDHETDRTPDTLKACAACLGKYAEDQKLSHLDRSGVARLLEHSMELSGDRKKLTLRFGFLSDVLKEADYWAGQSGSEVIGAHHIQEAIDKQHFRANLYEQHIKEAIAEDIFWVETEGSIVGQINGLSVMSTGDYMFGRPNRITVNIALGKEGVVSIDREAKMAGNIFNKAIMTLAGYLGERFAHNKPLTLSATLSFEQSYGMIEGDSATAAEVFCLLSAISGVPLFQGFAVTGSASQKGEIQPIGGVSHKIKGFYDICKAKGLTGRQGVIIPQKNVRNLMLEQEVVDVVREGKFHIHAIDTIEEGIELLTGMPAGKRRRDGTYPKDTVFGKVDEQLKKMAQMAKEFGEKKKEAEE